MRLHTIKHGNDVYVSRNDLLAVLGETAPHGVHPQVIDFIDTLRNNLARLGADRQHRPSGLVLPGQ